MEVSWYGVNGIIAGVQEIEKARESVAVLMKGEWHSAVINFRCVSSWILWLKFRFLNFKC